MPDATPIDQHSLLRSMTRLADQVIPPIDQLRRLTEVGYGYVGIGLLRVRSRWDVDRDGKLSLGGDFSAKADISKLLEVASAGGIPPAELAAQVKSAFDKVTSAEGGGVYELIFLPLVVPKDQIETTAATLREVFVGLAGRSELTP